MKRISIADAATRLAISPQAVRVHMADGSLPIGYVTGKKRKTYVVFEEKVNAIMEGAKHEQDFF